jgi:hypothetical protein
MTTEELNKPVSFPKWAEALAADPEVQEERRDSYRRAIMGYLKHLKERHVRASFASAKAYFDGEKEAGCDRKESREEVRCFFRAAKRWETEGGVGREESGVGKISNSEQGMSNVQVREGENAEGRTLNVERRTQK